MPGQYSAKSALFGSCALEGRAACLTSGTSNSGTEQKAPRQDRLVPLLLERGLPCAKSEWTPQNRLTGPARAHRIGRDVGIGVVAHLDIARAAGAEVVPTVEHPLGRHAASPDRFGL